MTPRASAGPVVLLLAALLPAACSDEAGPASTTAVTTSTTAGSTTSTLPPGPEPVESAGFWRDRQGEVIYFVMIDRFENGDPSNDTGGSDSSDPLVHGFLPDDKGFYHGGDLAGLTSRLDYLAGMGVTALWVTPPLENRPVQGRGSVSNSSAGYHGYWIVDFTSVDPHLGDGADLRRLVDEAHARGMKVFVDIVTNHTADVITYAEGSFSYRSLKFAPYRDASGVEFDLANHVGIGTFPELDATVSFPYTPTFATPADATAKHPDWLNDPIYYHNRGNTNFTGENVLLGDFFGLDDLFTEHPAVVAGMLDIYGDLVEEFDVDGFRVDTAKHVNDEFWAGFLPGIFERAASLGKEDFLVFGEVSGSDAIFNSRYLSSIGFPSVLDFGFSSAASTFVAGRTGSKVMADLFDNDDWYTTSGGDAGLLVTFIGNHDMGRLGSFVRSADPRADDTEQVRRASLALELLFTVRGVPTVYYGDEQGFVGDGGDKDARQDMFASQVASYNDDDLIGTDATTATSNFDTGHPLYQLVASLSQLRSAHPGLSVGAQITRYSQVNAGVFAFSRIDRETLTEYLIVANNAASAQTATFRVDTPDAGFERLYPVPGPGISSDAAGSVTVEVPALSLLVFRADRPLPTGGSEPEVTIVRPADGSTVDLERFRIEAETAGEGLREVSFAVSVDGGVRIALGTDWSPPYRVYWDRSGYPSGTTVEVFATARDASGRLTTTVSRVVLGAG